MQYWSWLFLFVSLVELALFFLLWSFFRRLKKSEDALRSLQTGHTNLLVNIEENAQLEKELISSFVERQAELKLLDLKIQERILSLTQLLEQAEAISHSPQFLREVITSGDRQGKNPHELARSTGLSLDEVNIILAQSRSLRK